MPKISLIQMKMSKDEKDNLGNALSKIKKAASKKAEIACLPELFANIYFAQNEDKSNFNFAKKMPNDITEALSESAKKNNIAIIGGSLFEKGDDEKFYNTTVVFSNSGVMLGKYRKIHIPYDPKYYEKTFFASGSEYKVFDFGSVKAGTLICYDQWFPEAARINALMGAQIVFYPTAIGFTSEMKKNETFSQKRWERDMCAHASANGMFVAAVNRTGKEEGIEFWGSSFVADPFGNVIARASSSKEEVLIADINLGLIENSREGWGFMRNRRAETYSGIIKKSTIHSDSENKFRK